VYAEGHDVDISVLPYSYVQRLIHDPDARAQDFVHLITPMFANGVRILFDPEQLVPQLAAAFTAGPAAFIPPPEAAFAQLVEDFWQRVVRIAKKLHAGYLYFAMRWCTAQINDLMRLVEWHARLTRNLPPSTWYRDKYLEQWADPRVVAALPQLYAQYDPADIQRALFAMMDLFRWIAMEIAAHLGYRYSSTSDMEITAWARRYLAAA
jgi:aminoglycoside 6-adenylyltransferase